MAESSLVDLLPQCQLYATWYAAFSSASLVAHAAPGSRANGGVVVKLPIVISGSVGCECRECQNRHDRLHVTPQNQQPRIEQSTWTQPDQHTTNNDSRRRSWPTRACAFSLLFSWCIKIVMYSDRAFENHDFGTCVTGVSVGYRVFQKSRFGRLVFRRKLRKK